MAKKYYALKLIPPRPTFAQDMTPEERNIMQQHVAYWTNLMQQGNAIAFGPVLDPKGVYGLGIIAVNNEEQLNQLMKGDPASGLNVYEWYPMMAITPENMPA